jgi:hypothetical protein
MTARSIEDRVARAAEAALADKRFVTPIDVLIGVGWLQPGPVDRWRQGRVEYLEAAAQVDSDKLSDAMAALLRWTEQQGLQPSETEYVARTRDRRRLRFTPSGDPAIERAYSTHWVSPELSERGEDPGRAGAGPGGHHACGGRLGAPRGHALRRAADVRGGQGRGKGPRPTRRRPSPGQLAPLTRPVRGAIPAPRPR